MIDAMSEENENNVTGALKDFSDGSFWTCIQKHLKLI